MIEYNYGWSRESFWVYFLLFLQEKKGKGKTGGTHNGSLESYTFIHKASCYELSKNRRLRLQPNTLKTRKIRTILNLFSPGTLKILLPINVLYKQNRYVIWHFLIALQSSKIGNLHTPTVLANNKDSKLQWIFYFWNSSLLLLL